MGWIVDVAKEVYGADPTIKTRKRRNVWARRAIYATNPTGETLSSIGQTFDQDHSTVIHQIRMHKDLMRFDKEYIALFDEFRKMVDVNPAKRYGLLKVAIPKDDELKQRILTFIEQEVEQYEKTG